MDEHYPDMNIHFPSDREGELVTSMKNLANTPWSWQGHNAMGAPAKEGFFFFHRDAIGQIPGCTVSLYRIEPGHIYVANVIPDELGNLSVDCYVQILRDFEQKIAELAANAVGGMTAVETHKYRMEDHFSAKAVKLLGVFCTTSNGLGSHPSDQKKWRDFLLCVHRDGADVHCDVFRGCLAGKKWWPREYIPELVHEYDFAMELLRQYDNTRPD